jgi:ankyrin repeat protein
MGMVELLLVKGANPNIASLYGITPLEEAVDKGYRGIADILVKHGAYK